MSKAHNLRKRKWVPSSPLTKQLAEGCMNCGHPGRHFVPPSFGDQGFWACEALLDFSPET